MKNMFFAVDGSNRKLLGVFSSEDSFWDWCWKQDTYKPMGICEEKSGVTIMFENVMTGSPARYR